MNSDTVTREHVLNAIAEYDELGDVAFLRRYGFVANREDLVWHDGRSYDSKALLGVALKFATGRAARSSEFNGGLGGAAGVLQDRDFEIITISEDDDASDDEPSPWRQAADLDADEARAEWAEAARGVLIETARHYGAVATHAELATLVQLRTRLRTHQRTHLWLPPVLALVAAGCAERGEPLLPALCVDKDGSVGAKYAATVATLRGPSDGDVDDQAAEERLECHRFFGAVLPEGGGEAAVTAGVAHTRSKQRAKKPPERVAAICPTCNMALLPSGACDTCD